MTLCRPCPALFIWCRSSSSLGWGTPQQSWPLSSTPSLQPFRLTNLGIRQVPSETVEAARAFGASPRQLLLKVQLPLALPTIMAGINQTTMMALAMVVIASMVSAGGLGQDVLTAIGGLKVGDSIVAGTASRVPRHHYRPHHARSSPRPSQGDARVAVVPVDGDIPYSLRVQGWENR